jgi:uncharacterized protein (TIGR00304 family)
MVLVLVGIVTIIVGALSYSTQSESESESHVGGVVMLGPFPIIFGSDSESVNIAAVMAVILMLIGLFIIFYMRHVR